jgi:hypothetical protein
MMQLDTISSANGIEPNGGARCPQRAEVLTTEGKRVEDNAFHPQLHKSGLARSGSGTDRVPPARRGAINSACPSAKGLFPVARVNFTGAVPVSEDIARESLR